MSPEELRALIAIAVQEGQSFPLLAYGVAFVLFSLAAFLGAYLANRKRGREVRADKEAFDAIRLQLAQTMRSCNAWLTQQQWAIREKHYLGLLTHLTKLRLSLADRESFFKRSLSENDTSAVDGEIVERLISIGDDAYQAIRDLTGPAAVFLSKEAISLLEQLTQEHWSVSASGMCTPDNTTQARKLVEVTEATVLLEAQRELKQWLTSESPRAALE